MKELSIEQKAQAYDKALERAREWYNDPHITIGLKGNLEDIFPKLAGSEDERVRKYLINYVKSAGVGHSLFDSVNTKEVILAWLEKQTPIDEEKVLIGARKDVALSIMHFLDRNTLGMDLSSMECADLESAVIDSDWSKLYDYMKKKLEKQGENHIVDNNEMVKSTDKVEPKFKVGDFLVNDYCMGRVVELTNDAYLLDTEQSIPFSCEHNAHLWTIEDAKDGDVLVCIGKYGQEIGIIKEYVGKYGGCDKCFKTYCFVDWDGIFRTGEYMGSKEIHPATKEQRDFLFQKIGETIYEWNAEKKELKKTKPSEWNEDRSKELSLSLQMQAYLNTASDELYAKGKPLYSEERLEDVHKCMLMWQKLHNAYFYQNPAWSEEDIEMLNSAISFVGHSGFTTIGKGKNNVIAWLKSLKQRIGG